MFQNSNTMSIKNANEPRLKIYYIPGLVVGEPVVHTSAKKGMQYLTIRVLIPGELHVSAFVGDCPVYDGAPVMVKVTLKEGGFSSYNIYPMNRESVDFMRSVVTALDAQQSDADDTDDTDVMEQLADDMGLPF